MLRSLVSLLVVSEGVSAFSPSTLPSSSLASRRSAGNVGPRQTSESLIRRECGLVAAVEDIWSVKGDGSDIKSSEGPCRLFDYDVLEDVTSILYHRGPDGMQIHADNTAPVKYGMGHTRLAIVDPANRNADQPFKLEFDDKVYHLASNGEIYNHVELYESLEDWPHERFSGSDCEVIGHAYAKYGGPKAVEKLDGMFAFVIFEEDENGKIEKIFAARDHVGIKPLYYAKSKDNGSWVFSSELKAMVGHVDPASVVAIPPGHYWTPETGMVCYYNPDWLRKVRRTQNES